MLYSYYIINLIIFTVSYFFAIFCTLWICLGIYRWHIIENLTEEIKSSHMGWFDALYSKFLMHQVISSYVKL